MSRLADALMGMDRGAARPQGYGGIPRLAEASARPRKWLCGGLLAIVATMIALSMGAVLRSPSRATPAPAEAARPRSAPAPIRPAALARTADEQFVSLVAEALRLAERGALSDAERRLRDAVALKPSHAETWNTLGIVLVRLGQTARGAEAFREAVRLAPTHAEAHKNLAVALDRLGQTQEAAVHYRAFLGLSGERHPARDDVARRLVEATDREPVRRQAAAAGDRTAPRP
jgi:Flp pilus assembly protein TadD